MSITLSVGQTKIIHLRKFANGVEVPPGRNVTWTYWGTAGVLATSLQPDGSLSITGLTDGQAGLTAKIGGWQPHEQTWCGFTVTVGTPAVAIEAVDPSAG